MTTKKLFIRTFGCQMNVHDSEQLAQLLEGSGYTTTGSAKEADLIIVNTCSIRDKAEQKVYSQLGRYRHLKKGKPGLMLGVCGCVAQQQGERLIGKIPYLDLVFGTHNIHRLPEFISRVANTGRPVVETGFHETVPSIGILALPEKGSVSAFVTIMQGCDNYCAFCVVPYLRGREESRKFHDILAEVRALAVHGVKEVTLLGQNVNSYGKSLGNGHSFSGLLRAIGEIEGIERIRFTTSHPKDLSDDIIACFRDVGALCEFIHLPVQSGSDAVLARMNRKYASADYLDCVRKLREACPGIAISSDIIVGFPGETEQDFQKTLDLMGKVRFDTLFSFQYSERQGTAAVGFDGKVDPDEKRRRLIELQSLQDRHTQEKNDRLVGSTVEVLVEGPSRNTSRDAMGRTRTNKIVNFAGGGNLVGKTVRVRIVEAFLHSLRGEMLD
ncbi:MAG TPA: tRNA (N6-isopentenyl adenosine(37)-C2)-methylthiotransferase MiaB [Syntrophales bacterium]|nr:tRNA (N6-isopentenyl adenosine(37)-C2)-methylthiotransferase MiaB [Syntrophales bacterium]